jgi:hypothetical protein
VSDTLYSSGIAPIDAERNVTGENNIEVLLNITKYSCVDVKITEHQEANLAT